MNVISYIRHEAGLANLTPATVIDSLQLDSLEWVDLLLSIEHYFSIRITPAEFLGCRTIEDLIKLVEGRV